MENRAGHGQNLTACARPTPLVQGLVSQGIARRRTGNRKRIRSNSERESKRPEMDLRSRKNLNSCATGYWLGCSAFRLQSMTLWPLATGWQPVRISSQSGQDQFIPPQATLSGVMPEMAWMRLSSVTSSQVKVQMISPENMAMIRSLTCSTSGISELITITA